MDHQGDIDFKLAEGRNLRLHTYPDLAAANADVASAPGRMIYVVSLKTAFFGMPGRWYPVGGLVQSAWGIAVNTPDDLAGVTTTDGEARIVINDPELNGRPNVFLYDGGEWRRVTDAHNTSLLKTLVTATGSVSAGTALALTGGGTANTSRTGSNGYVGPDAPTFAKIQEITIYLNGVMLDKGTDVVWTTATSITLPTIPLDAGDVLTVISYTP